MNNAAKKPIAVDTTPLNPRLPGRYGRMTAADFDAEFDRYDTPGVLAAEIRAFDAKRKSDVRHPPKRRLASKPAAEKAARVLITVEPKLLKQADAHVERIGQTRAGWIQSLMRAALAKR